MILATHGAYDPDEPEGSRSGGSQYVSKKDAKWVLIILVVLGAIFYPVYISLKAQGEKALCSANMQGIFKAMTWLTRNDVPMGAFSSTDEGLSWLRRELGLAGVGKAS